MRVGQGLEANPTGVCLELDLVLLSHHDADFLVRLTQLFQDPLD